LLVLLAVFFSFGSVEVFANCTDCTRTVTLPTNGPITVGPREKVCLVNNGSGFITYGGAITLSDRGTLCVGPNVGLSSTPTLSPNSQRITIINYGLWGRALNVTNATIDSLVNYGTMTLNSFTVNNNATFSNYGNLTINGSLIIENGSNRFNNRASGEVTVTGNVEVRGNGNNNGFFHSGANVTVLEDFIHGDIRPNNQNANSTTEISAPLTVRNLIIQGGNFLIDDAVLSVNNNYVQSGNNTRVSGGSPTENCGRIDVLGSSTINNGVFGANGFLGVCNPGTGQGGFSQSNGGTVSPNGTLGCSCNQPLPITLIYFTAKQQESQVLLQWATASEKDNEYFSLEKSRDGQQFNEVGRVAGAGTNTGKLNYQFTDDFPFGGTGYYRLKQVDFDGTFTYSRIVAVNSQITAALRIYPNPLAGNELWVEATDAHADDMRITIHNTVGKLLVDRVYAYEPAVKVDLSALRREPGLYIVSVRRKNRIERQKLVVH
jgi:hypothetical protein